MASSLRNLATVLATISVLLVVMDFNTHSVEAAGCDTNTILADITACAADINSTPNPNSQCCSNLRSINDMKPDAGCICNVLQNSAVVSAGLTKEKAVNFITVCVSAQAVPECLK